MKSDLSNIKSESDGRDGFEISDFPTDNTAHFSYLLWLSTITTEGLDAINMPSIPDGSKRGELGEMPGKTVYGVLRRKSALTAEMRLSPQL